MTDYREMMDLVLKGWSVRQIRTTVGRSHTTVQKAREDASGITAEAQLAGLCNEALAGLFHDGRSTRQGELIPIAYDAVPKARTGRQRVTLQVLGAATPPPRHRRAASLQLRAPASLWQPVDAAGLTARITHAPGHTVQADWAGAKMRLFDSIRM